MKSVAKGLLFLALSSLIAGCAGNRDAIVKAGESSRQDIFSQASNTEVTGKALLKIQFPVKTFKARVADMIIKHSDPSYTVTVNIDGQSMVLTNEPTLEKLSGNFKNEPEAGTGWKYNFQKDVTLAPGKHLITIAVPLSDVVVSKEVALKEGMNQLQLDPVYFSSASRYTQHPRFNQGLSSVLMKLNNQVL